MSDGSIPGYRRGQAKIDIGPSGSVSIDFVSLTSENVIIIYFSFLLLATFFFSQLYLFNSYSSRARRVDASHRQRVKALGLCTLVYPREEEESRESLSSLAGLHRSTARRMEGG